MNIGDLISVFTNIYFFAKLFILTLFFFYVVFALVVLRQVDLMNQIIGTAISTLLKLVATLHLVLVFILFVLGVVLL